MQSLDRVICVLSCLAKEPQGLGISEISALSFLPKSTLHRLLTAMVEYDLAIQDEFTKKYRLGSFMLNLGNQYLAQNNVLDLAKPYLKKLSNELKETIFLASLEGEKIICIDIANFSKEDECSISIGEEFPFNTAACAKAIIAFQPEHFISKLLALNTLDAHTQASITSLGVLKRHLSGVRISGYATSKNEFREGVHAIAVPIYEKGQQVNAAIAIIAPEHRLPEEEIPACADVLKAAANAIKRELTGGK